MGAITWTISTEYTKAVAAHLLSSLLQPRVPGRIHLNLCKEQVPMRVGAENTRSVRYAMVNDTAVELTAYNSVDCSTSTEYAMKIIMIDGACTAGCQRRDIVTVRNATADDKGSLRNTPYHERPVQGNH